VAYRWVEHTSELELEIRSPTQGGVFAEALEAFAELVADGPRGHPDRRVVELRADDRASLLAAWLDELVFLAETQGFVPERVELQVDGDALRATVHGHVGEPRHLVKAVTLHRLLFEPDGAGWRARVVLDV
jgi:SHS2 domain-containing protein